MIYHLYWSALQEDKFITAWVAQYYPESKVNDSISGTESKKILAEFIKEGKDDTFIFILMKNRGQVDRFDKWVEEHSLTDYIVVKSGGITNPIHQDYPDNLVLVVMQTKEHFARIENKELVQ